MLALLKSHCGWAADASACAARLRHWWVMALHCMVRCDGNGASVDTQIMLWLGRGHVGSCFVLMALVSAGGSSSSCMIEGGGVAIISLGIGVGPLIHWLTRMFKALAVAGGAGSSGCSGVIRGGGSNCLTWLTSGLGC